MQKKASPRIRNRSQESMNVRITQLDGKLPNLALMRLSHWHKSRGDAVYYMRTARRELFEPEYGAVYGSAIFKFTAEKIAGLRTISRTQF